MARMLLPSSRPSSRRTRATSTHSPRAGLGQASAVLSAMARMSCEAVVRRLIEVSWVPASAGMTLRRSGCGSRACKRRLANGCPARSPASVVTRGPSAEAESVAPASEPAAGRIAACGTALEMPPGGDLALAEPPAEAPAPAEQPAAAEASVAPASEEPAAEAPSAVAPCAEPEPATVSAEAAEPGSAAPVAEPAAVAEPAPAAAPAEAPASEAAPSA